ncbi:MAG: hypothetical protein ACJ789_18340 [Thermomicrobiales bacterium]|jgi:hypothetical protein
MESSENQIKRIVLDRMDRCGVCHRSYEPEDVHVLSRKPDFWMMLVQCTDCQAKSFVAAVMKDGDPKEARLALRQLTEQAESGTVSIETEAPDEIVIEGELVTAHDVLDMHEFLAEFDGDFKSLFTSDRSP